VTLIAWPQGDLNFISAFSASLQLVTVKYYNKHLLFVDLEHQCWLDINVHFKLITVVRLHFLNYSYVYCCSQRLNDLSLWSAVSDKRNSIYAWKGHFFGEVLPTQQKQAKISRYFFLHELFWQSSNFDTLRNVTGFLSSKRATSKLFLLKFNFNKKRFFSYS